MKCFDCGLLGVRGQDGQLWEVDEESRRLAMPPSKISRDQLFICAARRIGFNQSPGDMKAALEKERDCQSFTEWSPGSTPKEHKEMDREEFLLKTQQEEKERDRKWRERQESNQQTWLDKQARHQARTIMVSIVAIFLSPFVSAFCQWFLRPDPLAATARQAPSAANLQPVKPPTNPAPSVPSGVSSPP